MSAPPVAPDHPSPAAPTLRDLPLRATRTRAARTTGEPGSSRRASRLITAAGIAMLPPEVDISAPEIAVAFAGAALLAAIFVAAAAKQRADLRRLLDGTFKDVPRL